MAKAPLHARIRKAFYSRLGVYTLIFLSFLILAVMMGSYSGDPTAPAVLDESQADVPSSVPDDPAPSPDDQQRQEETQSLRIHFIDVGHGDAALVEFPNQANLLVDAGHEDNKRELHWYLLEEELSILDAILVTHPDDDHLGGVPNLLYKLSFISEIYDNGQEVNTSSYGNYELAIEKSPATRATVDGQTDLVLDESVETRLLLPHDRSYLDGTNDNSIVLQITYDDVSFLLMGDCEITCQQRLLERYDDLESDVYKVPHHGDVDALDKEFLAAVDPDYAVISTGDKERFGHPHDQVLAALAERGIQTYRTDTNETIIFETEGETLNLSFSSKKSKGIRRT